MSLSHSRKNIRPVITAIALAISLVACAPTNGEAAAKGKSAKSDATAAGGDTVVARIGSAVITQADLDEEMHKSNMKAIQAYYDAQKQTLDMLVDQRVMDAEATAKSKTSDELKNEILAGVPQVTDADAEKFFNDNKARLGGQTLDALRDKIKAYLQNQNQQQAMTDYIADARKRQNVSIEMEPPRVTVDVGEKDPKKGPSDAPVQIVEFSDFQCPFCGRVEPTIKQIEAKYGDKIQFVFRDFPLTSLHPNAQGAAEAANCANEQGKYWPYHDKLFSSQQALQPDKLKQYAVDLGLDAKAFNECVDSGRYRPDIQKDVEEGQRLGVTGTPAFFVNGRFLSGAQPLQAFSEIIDEELARGGHSATN
ncbi:MAG TPA: thioredoxin domain-containing protein [Candidatus Saccharimonadales bacterium]|nr:thioredoxin domain-containing protein [Candidatus Saccharimonadales bacterium]